MNLDMKNEMKNEMKNKFTFKKIIMSLAVLILISLSVIYFSSFKKEDKTNTEPVIATAAARKGTVSVAIESIAIAEPYELRTFRASSGGNIAEIAPAGTEIRRGGIIAAFETEEFERQVSLSEIALREALLNMEKTEAFLEKAEQTLSDRDVLFASGAVSREQLEQAREGVDNAGYQLKSSLLAVEKSRILLDTAVRNRSDAYIKAPFDGTVLKTFFSSGDWAGQNSVILTFGDISKLRFTGEVDEYDVGAIKQGMPVSITADSMSGTVLHAKIETVSPQAEIINNIAVFTVSAAAENRDFLMKPGMSADMSILLARAEGIVVPSRAVTTVRTRSYVDVLTENGPDTRRVTKDADDGVNAVITEGLEEGEIVVLPSQAGILPGLAPAAPEAGNSSGGTSIIPMPVPGGGGGGGGR